MRVTIEFDIDVADLNESAIHELIAGWTAPMRVSKRLRAETWKCVLRRIK